MFGKSLKHDSERPSAMRAAFTASHIGRWELRSVHVAGCRMRIEQPADVHRWTAEQGVDDKRRGRLPLGSEFCDGAAMT